MHVRLRRGDLVRDPRQRLVAVDEQLGPRPLTRRKRTVLRPTVRRRVDRARMAAPPEPSTVVADDEPLEPVADRAVYCLSDPQEAAP
ncbi:MAG TPA: hypothetical protein VE261_04300 [Gaiellaceae bacterium]|nr:hypothetical protein [Gaiellaceae bacterium]